MAGEGRARQCGFGVRRVQRKARRPARLPAGSLRPRISLTGSGRTCPARLRKCGCSRGNRRMPLPSREPRSSAPASVPIVESIEKSAAEGSIAGAGTTGSGPAGSAAGSSLLVARARAREEADAPRGGADHGVLVDPFGQEVYFRHSITIPGRRVRGFGEMLRAGNERGGDRAGSGQAPVSR